LQDVIVIVVMSVDEVVQVAIGQAIAAAAVCQASTQNSRRIGQTVQRSAISGWILDKTGGGSRCCRRCTCFLQASAGSVSGDLKIVQNL
jgi:hypothetical protein